MAYENHLGLFEGLFEKKPLTTAKACVILFVGMMSLFGATAFYVNELDRFLVDYPSVCIVLGSLILVYAEARQGVQIRSATKELCHSFAIDDGSRNRFLEAVFNKKARFVAGILGGFVLILLYEGLGFWYESAVLLLFGRIFAAFVGFIVGELAIASLFFILMSDSIIQQIEDQVDILDYRKLRALQSVGSVSIQNAISGCIAGFVALFGIVAAPWRTGLPATEIALAILCALFLLVAGELAIPINSIHKTMQGAKERCATKLSGLLNDANKKSIQALGTGFTRRHEYEQLNILLQTILVLDAQNQKYPEWPFNFRQVVGVIGSLGMVVVESLIVVLLSVVFA
ncbi:MAG: hypothetical protein EAX95_13620 [Candidatus Thorarchaeota archaeon]|nr:hypothetical protein [Candidatus Thorarchaeota archaeon]